MISICHSLKNVSSEMPLDPTIFTRYLPDKSDPPYVIVMRSVVEGFHSVSASTS